MRHRYFALLCQRPAGSGEGPAHGNDWQCSGESDNETLVREIEEELQAVIVAGTLVHFGTFETRSDHGGEKLP